MGMQDKRAYNYYAFISYSRKDEPWAEWLQKRLETYRIPAMLRKQNLNVPQKLYPVFRDKTDLAGGKLLEMLHEELDSSQYLIVICSPNSAGSEWVDKEVRHFMESGREEYIIPFIVDGEPAAREEGQECYPAALRTEGEGEFLGIGVKELGKEKAFLRVVAALLNLKFDQIVMRDRKRRVKQRGLAIAACVILLAGLLAGIWYYMPHARYYRDFVCCYEVPRGLYPLSREERMGRSEYYRIVTRQGKVVRLERVNSLGNPVQQMEAVSEEAYASIDFFYEGKQLSRAELRDTAGSLILVKDYSSNLKAVDFQKSDDSSQAFALSSMQGGYGLDANNPSELAKSEITRYINTYDENGYLVEELFMRDNRNTPAADSNGNYGFRYEREADGQVRRTIGLDEHGNPHNCRFGYAAYVYSYDGEGRRIARECFNAEGEKAKNEAGYFRLETIYDNVGNIISLKYLDEQNVPCNSKDGYAQTVSEYTEQGFVAQVRLLDREGNPVCSKEDGIHGYRYSYDEWGNAIGIEYFDNGMQPAYNNDGYAKLECVYGDDGRVAEAYVLGTDGEPVCEKNSGCAGMLCQWDENGNEISDTYLDTGYLPAISRYGYASVRGEYDSAGNLFKQSYYDANGEPMRIRENYASVEYEYDGIGNLARTVYKDEFGKPCIITGGYAESRFGYDDRGNRISERYYDEEGNQVIISEGYHECRMLYDDYGNCIRIEYCDENGDLFTNVKGFAYSEYLYDEYGNVLERTYYNEHGLPRQVRYGYSRSCWEYDVRGNEIKETRLPWPDVKEEENCLKVITKNEYDERDNLTRTAFFDGNGQPYEDEENIAVYEYVYDDRNRVIEMEEWYGNGVAGRKSVYEYDGRNQLIHGMYYTLKEGGAKEELANQIWNVYDAYGNIIRRECRDSQGKLMISENGCAYAEYGYTATGLISEIIFYDEMGKLCSNTDGYAHLKQDYDSLGNITLERFYDQDDKLYMVTEYGYNSQGWMLSAVYTDGEGHLISGEDGISKREYQYDKSGREIGCINYDADGNELVQRKELVVLHDIVEGSPGELAGMQNGDFLMKYGEWEVVDFANIIDAGDALNLTIQQGMGGEKELVIGRVKDGTDMDFYRFVFEPGIVGIHIVSQPCTADEMEDIFQQYEVWKNSNDI